MFFVSEEFLRQYESGEEFTQTIGDVLEPGHELFEEGTYTSKAEWKKSHKEKPSGGE